MNPTAKIFIRKDFKTKSGEYPVYLRFISNRRKKDISLGLSIAKIMILTQKKVMLKVVEKECSK